MSGVYQSSDTIAAIATPSGHGGVGILRLSGIDAVSISRQLIQGVFPKPRKAAYRKFVDDQGIVLDQGIFLFFPQPNSFTGEDVVEFQAHGSPAVLNMLLKSAIYQGAREARPGEFSERAFLNDRLDLIQAEAIADLIHANSEQAARAAMRSLQGVFSEKVNAIDHGLIQLRTQIEAAIDFSEEAIASLPDHQVIESIQTILDSLKYLKHEAQQGQRLQEGMHLVIAGLPNAGKSSLLNTLSGQATAIVSDIAGTTRDVLTADIVLDGLPIHILDTAGFHITENIVEQEGIRRAVSAIEKADQILWVVDSTHQESCIPPHETLALFHSKTIQAKIAIVRSKIDLSHESSGIALNSDYDTIRLSAVTGEGLFELKTYLKQQAGYNHEISGFSARQRHVLVLIHAEQILQEGLAAFLKMGDLEVLAMHLKEAHQKIGEITGLFTTEDLLGHIFSTFCIGK